MQPQQQVPDGFGARLIRNTVFGAGGRLIGLAVAVVLTPYIVARLGAQAYAVYALATTLTGYLALLDLGLGSGYVKYVAEAHARDDADGVNEVLASGFYAYLGFGAAILLGWYLTRDVLLGWVRIEGELLTQARAAFTIAVTTLALSGAAAAMRAVLYGLQRIDVAARIGVILILPRLVLVIAALELGYGVVGLVAADFLMFLVGSGAMTAAAVRVFPPLSLVPRRVTWRRLRLMLRYGVVLQVSRLSEMVNFHLDKLLLAGFAGLQWVTHYDLGAKLLTTARSIPLLVANAAVPAVSDLDARGAEQAITRLSARLERYLFLIGLPLFGLLVVEAPRLVEAWLGPGHGPSATALRILAVGYLANVASGAFTTVTQGIDRNEFQLRLAVLALVANVALSVPLVILYGYPGVLVGTSSALVLTYGYGLFAFRRLLRERSPTGVAYEPVRLLAPAVAVVAAVLADLGLAQLLPWGASRVAQLLSLAGSSAGYVATFCVVLWALGGVQREDRELLTRLWGRES